ncbi:MAG TPA: glycosyltransferase, partial [Clostridia bacterium]|nr:glycosyltransferase [Clostridia bacterium]
PAMYEKCREGYDIVYGKRIARHGESFFKLFTAKVFYKIINKLTNNLIPMDTGDFRLIGRKAVDALNSMPEHARFLRGMGSWTGFSQCPFLYERDKRFAGKTKYSLKKMLKLASDGIFSFSYAPLVLPYIIGLAMKTAGLVWLIVLLFMLGKDIPSWQPVIAFMLLIAGIILLCMGIIGTYIARIYEEAKGRPLYIIDKTIGF